MAHRTACLTNTSHSRIQERTSPTKPSKKRAPSHPINHSASPAPNHSTCARQIKTNPSVLDDLQLTTSSFTETVSYLWCSASTKNSQLSVTISNAYLACPCCRGSDSTGSIFRGCWTRLRLDELNLGAALRTGEGEGGDRSLDCCEGVMWIVSAQCESMLPVAASSDQEMYKWTRRTPAAVSKFHECIS